MSTNSTCHSGDFIEAICLDSSPASAANEHREHSALLAVELIESH